MGCQQGSYNDNDYCVKDVVRNILDAQRKARDEDSHSCKTSCDRSIDDLLSPDRHCRRSRYTTIPFMLMNRDGKPFVGSGFTSRKRCRGDRDDRRDRRGHFHCVESPVFKVKGFQRGSNSCVTLELLEPAYDGRDRRDDRDGDDVGGERRHDHHCNHGSFCECFGNRYIENFRYTGVCITVDLDCFCGISCLDPIRPDDICD